MVTVSAIEATVSTADLVAPLYVAEIVTAVDVATEMVETGKFALQAPAGTVTVVGTVATAGSLLESVTTAPSAGAAALRVTVPVEGVPAVTLAGLRLTETGGGGNCSWALLTASSNVAQIATTP